MENSGKETKNGMLEIQMLGDFSLRNDDKALSGDKVRGKQVWNLLEYIIVNRHKEISLDGLIQTLWGDDEIEDPANALKNLVYRLRTTLRNSLGLNEDEYIVYRHGSYVWNKEIPCRIDVDELEAAYKAARHNGLSSDEQLALYEKIMELYKGNFLPHSSFKEWVVPLTVYYQRIYMESVAEYCAILLERKNFNRTEEICRRAIEVDPFVEINHAFLIKALAGQKNYDKAIHHYNYINKLFYDELGVRPSDLITKLYHEIVNKNPELDIDITHIKANLKEENEIKGAVYCNYEEFKTIYQFEARAALRSGKTVFIALVTVTGKHGKALTRNHFEETFEKIKNNIVQSLRKDDIVTRYGRTQFLLMLSNLTLEDSNMVLNRLIKKMNESGIADGIEVFGQLQSLDPVELEVSHV